jgi:hypothetical protein
MLGPSLSFETFRTPGRNRHLNFDQPGYTGIFGPNGL